MICIEDDDFLKETHINFISSYLNKYIEFEKRDTIPGSNNFFFVKCILSRYSEKMEKRFFHDTHKDFEKILYSFCYKYNIICNEVLRIAINLTYNNGHEKCDTHMDHYFNHLQLLIYLNDADIESKTVILSSDYKIIKEIAPKKYKSVLFNGYPHYHYFPKIGLRYVLVFTFR